MVEKIDEVSPAKHLGISEGLNSSPTATTLLVLDKTHLVFFFFFVM